MKTVLVTHPNLMHCGVKVSPGLVEVEDKYAEHWVSKGYAKTPESEKVTLEVATPEKKAKK